MWTWLMVRLWAIMHEKEYRKAFFKGLVIFIIALAILVLGFEVLAI